MEQTKNLFRAVLIVVFSFIMAGAAVGQYQYDEPMPKADKNGDYITRGYPHWEVVDQDPNGLNARLALDFPPDWFSPSCNYSDNNILSWPVIRRFKKGTILKGNGTPAGFTIMKDNRNLPWLKVDLGNYTGKKGEYRGEAVCLVRANSRFIRPVRLDKNPENPWTLICVINDPDGYVNVREAPGTNSRIIEKITLGRHFMAIPSRNPWKKVFTVNGRWGYMHESRIKAVRHDGYAIAQVTDGAVLPLKEGPADSFPDSGTVKGRQFLMVITPDYDFKGVDSRNSIGPWFKVVTGDGKTGYLNTSRKPVRWIPF